MQVEGGGGEGRTGLLPQQLKCIMDIKKLQTFDKGAKTFIAAILIGFQIANKFCWKCPRLYLSNETTWNLLISLESTFKIILCLVVFCRFAAEADARHGEYEGCRKQTSDSRYRTIG